MFDPVTEITAQLLDITADREWAEEVITDAVRDTRGELKPSTLFAGLSDETATLFTRALNSLIDRQILSTYFAAENGTVETFIGFSVAA